MELKLILKKNIILIGLIISVIFLFISAYLYPGGNPVDPTSVGYSFTKNYISNLLEYKALNGANNIARPFGIIGVVLLGLTSGFAFVRFAEKVNVKKYSIVIKYLGLLLIFVSALITIPSLHDGMVTLSSIITLLILFYITVLIFKSKLGALKIISVLFLAIFYAASYMYFTRTATEYLPIVQKLIHVLEIVWILGLEYYTKREDFEGVK